MATIIMVQRKTSECFLKLWKKHEKRNKGNFEAKETITTITECDLIFIYANIKPFLCRVRIQIG